MERTWRGPGGDLDGAKGLVGECGRGTWKGMGCMNVKEGQGGVQEGIEKTEEE